MLACARIGAVHSVVFGGFAAKELATRIDDAKPKLILSASCGIEPGRIVALQAAARRGDRARAAQAARPASILQRPQAARDADRRPRSRLGGAARRRDRRAARRADCVPVAGHRSALHPLHLGHDRHAEGRGARQWRPHGRAEMVDAESLRRQARRGVVVRLRHRLGGRPLLHRLRRRCCTAAPRSSTRASRSARPTPAPSGA